MHTSHTHECPRYYTCNKDKDAPSVEVRVHARNLNFSLSLRPERIFIQPLFIQGGPTDYTLFCIGALCELLQKRKNKNKKTLRQTLKHITEIK